MIQVSSMLLLDHAVAKCSGMSQCILQMNIAQHSNCSVIPKVHNTILQFRVRYIRKRRRKVTVHVHPYNCRYSYMYAFMYACVFVCMHAYMYVCMFVERGD